MTVRAEVRGELLAWARHRSGLSLTDLRGRFPKLDEWENEVESPTIRQLERFAAATHTPIGFFFLAEPPIENLPLPDFRTVRDQQIRRPSADLLDVVFECQQRQSWYKDNLLSEGAERLPFVGFITTSVSPPDAGNILRNWLDFGVTQRNGTIEQAFRQLADKAEDRGVLVMVNGVVGSNTHRKLKVEEFRGFAIADSYAPLVFINGADTKAGQIFSLAHELAHICIGESGISDIDLSGTPGNQTERWCNRVAAEFLIPTVELRRQFNYRANRPAELERLSRVFKASTLAILKAIYDAGLMGFDEFREAYESERRRILAAMATRREGQSGNFYNTQLSRTGRKFAREVVVSALEGRTLYRDAMRLLGVRKAQVFDEMAERLGVA